MGRTKLYRATRDHMAQHGRDTWEIPAGAVVEASDPLREARPEFFQKIKADEDTGRRPRVVDTKPEPSSKPAPRVRAIKPLRVSGIVMPSGHWSPEGQTIINTGDELPAHSVIATKFGDAFEPVERIERDR
ncbi:MAG: hypothetical protein WBQ41_09750 [Solirubrobacterales bacterium]